MITVLQENNFIVLLHNIGIDVNAPFSICIRKHEKKHPKTTENQPRKKFHHYFKER